MFILYSYVNEDNLYKVLSIRYDSDLQKFDKHNVFVTWFYGKFLQYIVLLLSIYFLICHIKSSSKQYPLEVTWQSYTINVSSLDVFQVYQKDLSTIMVLGIRSLLIVFQSKFLAFKARIVHQIVARFRKCKNFKACWQTICNLKKCNVSYILV